MVPAPLKTRLALVLARLLLVCIGHILGSAPGRSAEPDGHDPENDTATAGSDSAAIRMARFTRHNYARAKTRCQNYVTRARATRRANAERAEAELQNVLGEVGKSWRELQECIVSGEQQHSSRPGQQASPTPSAPSWADDVRARSRVALGIQAEEEPRSTDEIQQPVESAAHSAEPAAIDEPPMQPQQPDLPPDNSTSDRGRSADKCVRQPATTWNAPANILKPGVSEAEAVAETSNASIVHVPADISVADEGIAVKPATDARRPRFHSVDMSSATVAPEAMIASASYPAEHWPDLPTDPTQSTAPPGGVATNPWPTLPDDPVLERQAPTSTRSAPKAERQRALEQEQRGEPWNG